MLPARKDLRLCLYIAAITGSWAALSGSGMIPRAVSAQVSNFGMTLALLVSGACCFWARRRHTGRMRTGWTLIGTSLLITWSTQGLWIYQNLVLGVPQYFPSPADIGYLSAAPLLAAGVIYLASTRGGSFWRLRTLLDTVVVCVAAFMLAWSLLLENVYERSSHLFLLTAMRLAYPFVDILMLSIALFAWTRAPRKRRPTLLMVAAALTCVTLADSAYAYLVANGRYYVGHPMDMAWLSGSLVAAVAALRSRPAADAAADDQHAGLRLPYVISVMAIATTLGDFAFDSQMSMFEAAAIAVLLGTVVLRQFLLVIDQQRSVIARMRSIDETKTGILYAVSHELRTPLTFIKGATGLLADGTLPESSRADLIAKMSKSSDRLESMIVGMLDLDRLLRGVVEPARENTDVTAALARAAEPFRGNGHIIEIDGTMVNANVDPNHVERIAQNLLANAVRHTPNGTRVSARVMRKDEGVLISVTDDGPGVAKEVAAKIFEPFTQSENLSDLNNGTGIGLALVAKFAEAHGGRAWVEPAPVRGAAFHVYLPEAA